MGPLLARADKGQLIELSFYRRANATRADANADDGESYLDLVQDQLAEYFAARRTHFDLRLNLRGPEFHQRVWAALLEIPYGETSSYGELAVR